MQQTAWSTTVTAPASHARQLPDRLGPPRLPSQRSLTLLRRWSNTQSSVVRWQRKPHQQRSRTQRCIPAASTSSAAAGAGGAAGAPSLAQKVIAFQQAFWKFLRPHTIRGTILGSCAVTAKAVLEHPELIDWGLLPKALLGVLALLCGNGYIVGINQIFDDDIDKVNKPFLPIASGELTKVQGWLLCSLLAGGGLAIVTTKFGSLITKLYSFGLFLGTIYSVPPLRLKRFAVAAFMIIATVRGFLLNFGVYHAVRAALGLPFVWSPVITFVTCFVTVFATVIAVTKDLPDIEGDRKYNIDTLATRLGVRTIAFAGSGLLVANYLAAIILAIRMPGSFRAPVMIGGHAVLALALIRQTLKLESDKYTVPAIQAFYRFIWNLFYSEYLLLPFL
ncbi:hypothetical protein ABBQ32_002604 [Trebouxia sp. C0010 RCD-2024]